VIRSKRYTKLIADEKANAEKKGFLNGVGGAVLKKRGPPTALVFSTTKKMSPLLSYPASPTKNGDGVQGAGDSDNATDADDNNNVKKEVMVVQKKHPKSSQPSIGL
jgi:hypothetical protein